MPKSIASRFLFFALMLFMVGCSSDRTPLFEVQNEVNFILPGGLNTIETHVFVIRDVPTFFRSGLTTNGFSESDVVSIGATRATIASSGQVGDFSFMSRVSVRAISQSDSDLNKEMFFLENIPFNQSGELRLFSSITELVDILREDVIDLEIRITLRNSTPLDLQNKLIFNYAVFDVDN